MEVHSQDGNGMHDRGSRMFFCSGCCPSSISLEFLNLGKCQLQGSDKSIGDDTSDLRGLYISLAIQLTMQNMK